MSKAVIPGSTRRARLRQMQAEADQVKAGLRRVGCVSAK